MPWKETKVVKERVKFLLEWERRWNEGEGRMNFSALCREFGVSRQVGYVWLERFREAQHDVKAAEERSRPVSSPTKVATEMEGGARRVSGKAAPTWGPKKIHGWVLNNRPDIGVPAPSTIGEDSQAARGHDETRAPAARRS